ncbi:MAG: GPR endopeptidase [Bacilli bacterium]|nr:GPR endopeptidase [Bacilli bacterium]
MGSIDLKKYDLRSDLIIESNLDVKHLEYKEENISVDYVHLNKDNLGKRKGDYITISFLDITDSNNFNKVLKVLNRELKKIFKLSNIKDNDKCLIIGLGNNKSTPDSLGFEVLKNIIVTRHLDELNLMDRKYRSVACLEPSVIGNTGIDSFDIIEGVNKKIKPDFVIVIDSLAAINISRIEKTIQISNTGISPGSGIGNNRPELSFESLGCKVIAIGIPTVVSSAVIVNDTINYLTKKISYQKNNLTKSKMISPNNLNYLKEESDLSNFEKEKLLGIIGTLSDSEIKSLVYEVLNPIGYNLIVSTKEIDFMIEKFGKLIGMSLNECLHKN